jgi:iron complex transport system permease protein
VSGARFEGRAARSWRNVAFFAICLVIAVIGIAAGPTGWIAPWNAVLRLVHSELIVAGLRAPRVALSAIVGASLGLAGAAMQVLLRNDLADPYVLGLSGGASVGAVASLALFPAFPPGIAGAAGAATAALAVRGIARGPYDPSRLLLAGVAMGSLLASATGLILVLAPQDRLLRSASFWLFGGLGTPQWRMLIAPALLLLLVLAWFLPRSERLDRLTMGEDVATSLGVDARSTQRWILALAVLLTASAVAVGGLIGFVGLIAPHSARRLVGATHRAALPATVMLGAALVMAADIVARTAFAPQEVPVGLVTASVGGPFFLTLISRRRT